MPQHSQDGTPVQIETLSGHLLFIDPLYLGNIRDDYDGSTPRVLTEPYPAFVQALEAAFFPNGGGSLLGYMNVETNAPFFSFDISRMRYYSREDEELEQLSVAKKVTGFSSDSGAFVLMDIRNFFSLLELLDFEDLVDAADSNFQVYADKINAKIGNKGWAYINSPGVGSGFEFEGSGSFLVT